MLSELKLTPRTVKEVEDKANLGIIQIFAKGPSVKYALIFLEKGLGITQDQAEEKMMEFFKSGDDINILFVEIAKQLQTTGFLSRELDLGTTENQIKEALAAPADSQTTGEGGSQMQ